MAFDIPYEDFSGSNELNIAFRRHRLCCFSEFENRIVQLVGSNRVYKSSHGPSREKPCSATIQTAIASGLMIGTGGIGNELECENVPFSRLLVCGAISNLLCEGILSAFCQLWRVAKRFTSRRMPSLCWKLKPAQSVEHHLQLPSRGHRRWLRL